MEKIKNCINCGSSYIYQDREIYICSECAHEWSIKEESEETNYSQSVLDAHGNLLSDGDTVTLIKDLKVKGTSSVVKVGAKVKNIRINLDSDHNIDCKIPGVGNMGLKSEYVKKS